MIERVLHAVTVVLMLVSAMLAPPAAGQTDPLVESVELSREVVRLHGEGRYAEAEPLARRVLALREQALGPDDLAVAAALNNLALLLRAQGRLSEAEPLYRRDLAISEAALGPDRIELAASLNNLAGLLQAQGRYGEAEPLFRRTLAISEAALGPDHPNVGATLNNLAVLLRVQGRYGEAEPLYRRALSISEAVSGPDHPTVALNLNNLAALLEAQGRPSEAEPLQRRALAIRERALDAGHPHIAASLINLAGLVEAQGRLAEAEPLYRRALAIYQAALGADHPETATAVNNLAGLLRAQRRYAEAEPLQRRALESWERMLGPDHPDVATSLDNLAVLLAALQRGAEAEPLQRRALAIRERALGPEHPDVVISLTNLAELLRGQGRIDEALAASRRAVDILAVRFARADPGRSKGRAAEQRGQRGSFLQLVSLLAVAASSGPEAAAGVIDEAFRAAQLAGGIETARAVSGMAARFAAGSDALAEAVRERQDLIERWRVQDQALLQAVAASADRRDAAAEDALRRGSADVEARLTALDARLATDFPRYAEIANPRPASLASVQALLAEDEALLAWSIASDEGFVFAIRRDRAVFARIAVTAADLREAVAVLRSGLEPPAMMQGLGDLPKFDVTAAHALYGQLLSPAEPLLADARHVLVVPDGVLRSLPLGVLVTQQPRAAVRDIAGYADVPWLARRYAMTVLPAVSSLGALRLFAANAKASRPFAGFGDPSFNGPPGDTRSVRLATLFRGGLADPAELRQLPRLPNTGEELRAQARALQAPDSAVSLGASASETAVKQADLSGVRVLSFATHGLISGEIVGLSEPALALTPPATATAGDDGLLTASEVALLKLNADWVVLSACNTAAPDGSEGAEGLSGLAKAFFYAGARSLLVSHWPVETNAAVAITTGAFQALERDPGIGRSEAVRRAMLAMIDRSQGALERKHQAHPMFWAPFVLVGEGAAGH